MLCTRMMENESIDGCYWSCLSRPILCHVFQFLPYKQLINVGAVCRYWFHASRDELLWKRLFYIHFKVDHNVRKLAGRLWYEEFKRLCYNIPMFETETLTSHTNEVLHVSFSHNGKYFATCSKDGTVLLWNANYPVTIEYSYDMKEFSWKFTQYSQFNESDTLLLVSGVHFGTAQSTSGEIAVFSILGDLTLQCRVVSKPSDIFGTWYSDQYLLSGDLHSLAHLVSTSVLWLNKASQEVASEHIPITQYMYRFYNRNASSIRLIMIANCGESEHRAEQFVADAPLVANDKYLIFTTGFQTYTPHQIGFKRIKPFVFPKLIDPGLSLQERLSLREQRKELQNSGNAPAEPDWLDYDSVSDRFDKIDHVIDLHGHIIGMALSPDHRYLYVNSRPWPKGYTISHPLDPPPIAQEIDIHVIDMVTLQQVGTMLRSHKAYTPNNECFFIFLNVCNEYVASGAEDRHGYLWDRHYGVCLAKFPHDDVVNSVAFNPKDPEMLVTTSDDHRIKIWRSHAKVRSLGLPFAQLSKAIELQTCHITVRKRNSFAASKCVNNATVNNHSWLTF